MTTDILIKSYPGDFEWLKYCLRSIQKYVTGVRQIILIVPPGSGLNLTAEKVIEVSEDGWKDGYMCQQAVKMDALNYTDADFVMHVDSDMVFKKPFRPEMMMVDGQVSWRKTPWKDCGESEIKAWRGMLTKFMGFDPGFEYMRQSNIMIPRSGYSVLSSLCRAKHGCCVSDYIKAQPGREFSEYNCIGAAMDAFRCNGVKFYDTSVSSPPDAGDFIDQCWSWGGISDEIRNRLEEITK